MRTYFWLALILIFTLGLTACPSQQDVPEEPGVPGDGTEGPVDELGEPVYGGIYQFPLDTDPPTLDPAMVTDTVSSKVVGSIFDGLVKISPAGEYVPAIADRWEANEDGTVWTFYLKDNVYFHHGPQVKAEDFAYSFTRVLNPDTASPRTWVLDKILGARAFLERRAGEVEGIKVIDEMTLEITLEEPFAPFLGLMAMATSFAVPKDYIDQYGSAFASEPGKISGTGPFVLQNWERNNYLLLQSNEEYFEGRPYVDGLKYRIIKEPIGRLEEFRSGNLHHTDVPPEIFADIEADAVESQWIVRRPLMDVYNLGFNCEKAPFKDNPTLRKAFCYAINRDFLINDVLSGVGEEATSIVPPGIYGYDAGLEGYPYNVQTAKALLEEAGYPNGTGLPEITLMFDSRPPRPDICQAVQNDLARIGVNINLRQLEWDPFLQAVDAGEPEFFQLTWLADYPDPENFLFVLLHSSQWGELGNGTRYKNEEFDALVDEAGIITDRERRWELYAQAERIAYDEAPWLILFFNECAILVNDDIRGLEITALDRAPVLPSVEIENVWIVQE